MKKLITASITLLLILSNSSICNAYADSGNYLVEKKTVNEIECYTAGEVTYPAVFGEPKLSSEDIALLVNEKNIDIVAEKISTIPDCLAYLTACNMKEGTSETPEAVLIRRDPSPYGMCQLFLYILNRDYEECGHIMLTAADNSYVVTAVKDNGIYYAFDPFNLIRSGSWIGENMEGSFKSTDIQGIIYELVENCDYSDFSSGKYYKYTVAPKVPIVTNTTADPNSSSKTAENAETSRVGKAEKEKIKKEFKMQKYSDDELKELAVANISFTEACEKLSTVSDALKFLIYKGYTFSPDDGGIAAATRYELNCGGCVGTSALMNALLEGDYAEQGYVYIYQTGNEHVFNYYVLNGKYIYCDFIYGPFRSSGTVPEQEYIRCISSGTDEIFDVYLSQEPQDMINDKESNFYLVTMYATRYFGNPTMPQIRLMDTAARNTLYIPLSANEKASLKVYYQREGYNITLG